MKINNEKTVPLVFVQHDNKSKSRKGENAWTVASHVSSRYRKWKKTNLDVIVLHPTTKNILQAKFETKCENTNAFSNLPNPGYSEFVELLEEYHRQLLERNEHFADGFSKKTFMFQWQSSDECSIFERLISPQSSTIGSNFLDPFTPTREKFRLDIESNLHFYFKVIRPYAKHLINDWDWFGHLPYIQASPVLAYAVASYASAFLSGCLKGGPGVVLPPIVPKGQRSLWKIPHWFRLQTNCLSELGRLLESPQEVDESCLQAIVFLFRLSVLLADGVTARMHYKALRRVPTLIGLPEFPIEAELAVAKVNIIAAFLHNQSIVLVKTKDQNGNSKIKRMVELDRKLWTSDREWYNHRASLAGRMLAWRSDTPSSQIHKNTAAAIARLDPASEYMIETPKLELQRCYQIALYFTHHLNAVNFNTAAPYIRSNLKLLATKLAQMDLQSIATICRCTMFNILLQGAVASRGHWERGWFVRLISQLYHDVHYMDDVYYLLVEFIDPFGIVFYMVEEVWQDVLNFRASESISLLTGEMKLYQGAVVRPVEQNRPITYSPDLSRPTQISDAVSSATESAEDLMWSASGPDQSGGPGL